MRRMFGFSSSSSSSTYIHNPANGPLSGNDSIDPFRAEDVLHVKHNSDEYLFKYPTNTIAEHKLNVGHVREKCAEILGLEVGRVKLICMGHQLKDDQATLKSLGIENGGRLLCVGSNSPRLGGRKKAEGGVPAPVGGVQERKKPGTPVVKQKLGPRELMDAVKAEVDGKLGEMVEEYCVNTPAEREKAVDMHRRLSETVMKEIIKLDGVESEDPEIRKMRKELIKYIQTKLDALDAALARV